MTAIEQDVCITLSWKVSLAQLPGFPHTETPGLEAEGGRGSVGRNRRGRVGGWELASLNHFSRQSGERLALVVQYLALGLQWPSVWVLLKEMGWVLLSYRGLERSEYQLTETKTHS